MMQELQSKRNIIPLNGHGCWRNKTRSVRIKRMELSWYYVHALLFWVNISFFGNEVTSDFG